MILGAGRGTRLGALGRETPKVLVDVGGKPLLERHLAFLAEQRIDRVVVNAHHLHDQVESFLRTHSGPVETRCVVEPTLLGTAGGVRNALPWLHSDPFLVIYGDVLLDQDLGPLIAAHRRHGAVATLAVYQASDVKEKGVVEVTPDDRVVRFREKPGDEHPGPGWINAGLYVVQRSLIERLPASTPADFGHDLLPAAVSSGERVFAHRLPHPVIDLGTPQALELGRSIVQP